MIRIGFVFSLDDGWLGGINYFRNLLTALYGLPDRQIEAVIFTGLGSSEHYFEGFPAVKIVRSRLFDVGSIAWHIRQSVLYIFSRDFLLEWLLKIHNISLLSHSDWLKGNAQFPAIGWIPDFQHVRLPEFFSMDEIAARNKIYTDMCQYCSTIIVSSFDAQDDLKRFAPSSASKSEVLQFVVALDNAETIMPSREELETRYKFSGKYFLLPNQFWKHKNHSIVIEALGLLIEEEKKVLVISTGNTNDYRHPKYFEFLMERARDLNVTENFYPLGLVPKKDLTALMLHSCAIINPSFSEGWSTTVEEAKSLGKQVLLSDIPVHREQNPSLASYFQPEDANALATLLWEVWNKSNSNEMKVIEKARCATNERRLVFAKEYQRIVLSTLRDK